MMDNTTEMILQPVLQYGFAGLSVGLLGFIAWLVKRLMGLLESTTTVIQANTNVIQCLRDDSDEIRDIVVSLNNKLLARPCIAKKD